MKNGRSFFKAGHVPAVALLITLALLPIAPPPAPAAAQSSQESQAGRPQIVFCPRCGYLMDPEWRYCPGCGWDLRTLVGEEARQRLESIGHSVLGLVVTKSDPSLKELLSPEDYAMASRYYIFYRPGLRKSTATAFPYLRPGIFLTSARSLEHGEFADVRTYNNRTYKAEILGYDIASGVGVIQADVPGAAPLHPAESPSSVSEGAWVVCYPTVITAQVIRYLPQSLHRGRLTSLHQSGTGLVSFEDLLRSDHAIPEGCTGGPLLDLQGGAAGMVLGSPDPGLTYSLPLAGLGPIVEALSRKTPPQRPYFGFALVAPDDRRRARFGLSEASAHPLVPYLIPDSPAEKAGILPGDLLAAVGGQRIATVAEAGGLLLNAAPGGPAVALTLLRGGKEVRVEVPPGQRPRRVLLLPVDELQESLESNLSEVITGATSRQGLQVKDLVPGGRGEVAGYKNGDIIVSVNRRGLRRFEAFNEIVRSGNGHVFGGEKTGNDPIYSTYRLVLEVRAEGNEKKSRSYLNLFPDILAPPVY